MQVGLNIQRRGLYGPERGLKGHSLALSIAWEGRGCRLLEGKSLQDPLGMGLALCIPCFNVPRGTTLHAASTICASYFMFHVEHEREAVASPCTDAIWLCRLLTSCEKCQPSPVGRKSCRFSSGGSQIFEPRKAPLGPVDNEVSPALPVKGAGAALSRKVPMVLEALLRYGPVAGRGPR